LAISAVFGVTLSEFLANETLELQSVLSRAIDVLGRMVKSHDALLPEQDWLIG